nr:MAG TPA: hypothetical protein [Caudoviricetes sp.]
MVKVSAHSLLVDLLEMLEFLISMDLNMVLL